jgi:hypothetical protein
VVGGKIYVWEGCIYRGERNGTGVGIEGGRERALIERWRHRRDNVAT